MMKICFLYLALTIISGCNLKDITNNEGAALSKDNVGSSIENIKLVSLDDNSLESSNQLEDSNQASLNLIVGKDILLSKLKKQFYNPEVGFFNFPKDEVFFNILQLTPNKSQIDAYEQLAASDSNEKKIEPEKNNTEDLMSNIEITNGFFALKAYKKIENKIYFALYDRDNYFDSNFDEIKFGLPSNFFLRIKDAPFIIDGLVSSAPFLVYHIYEDKKSIGITNNTFAPITISITNESTQEVSIIELILEPHVPYVDENGNIYYPGWLTFYFEPPSAPISSNYTSTNNQVQGVSESDRVKTDGKYIYSINQNKFKVFDIKKGEDIANIEIDFNSFYKSSASEKSYLTSLTNGYYNSDYSEIDFLNGNIIVFSRKNGKTLISFIDISHKNMPIVSKQLALNSVLISNRIVDGKIILVSSNIIKYKQLDFPYRYAFTPEQQNKFSLINELILDQISISDFSLDLTIAKTENKDTEIITYNDADNIYFNENAYAHSISKFVILNSDGVVASSTGTISTHYDDIYVSSKSIFLFSSGRGWSNNSVIYYFDMQNFKLDFKGGLNLKGTPLSKFSFHQQNNYLFMAFHDNISDDNGIHTILLGDKMKLSNTLKGMAPGENLKSVCFVEDKAFIVTFKVIDPLFIIDFANPVKPAILGEIKVSGFSTYLHEIYDGILVGVGFEANENGSVIGAKVSTFNVKAGNSFEIDKAVCLNAGYKSINFKASLNHLDFVWHPTQKLLALTYSGHKKGFLVYRLNNSGAILDVANVVTDNDLYSSNNEGLDKILFVGNTLYYSKNGNVSVFPVNSLNFLQSNKTIVAE